MFVHGNPGSGADWEPLLAAVGERRRAVAWDAPGFGGARTPAGFARPSTRTPPSSARALDALAIDRAHLVVHDFGGPWGLRWAAEHPDRFASAVLLGTGVLPGYRWHALARVWRTPLARRAVHGHHHPRRLPVAAATRQPAPLPRAFVDRMYDDFDRHTRRAVLELYRSVPDVAAAGERLAAALRPLDRPALVLWGRHDPYLPAALAERQRDAFPHADVHVLERSGHWPFIDDHETVAAATDAFLDRHAGTRTDPDPPPRIAAALQAARHTPR